MSKSDLLAQVIARLRDQHDRMLAAAKAAESYAKDADSKAESKYDTRGLEASYLAAGQAEKVEELGRALEILAQWEPPAFAEDDTIDTGALVESDVDGDLVFFFVAPAGGGVTGEYLGCNLTVVTPESPLGEKLQGMRAGDEDDASGLVIYAVS